MILGPAAVLATAAHEPATPAVLPGSEPLTLREDLTRLTNGSWQEFLRQEIAAKKEQRGKLWARDQSSKEAYERSIQPKRKRFRRYIGAIDPRFASPRMEFVSPADETGLLAETGGCQAWSVRWTVLDGVNAEGIMLRPNGEPQALVVLVPDAEQLPEDLAGLGDSGPTVSPVARQLAESGAVVIIPVLVSCKSSRLSIRHASPFTGCPMVRRRPSGQPRPFMMEFGYNDRAVQLEGAAAEYAKIARLYFRLGIPERTAIEFFGGAHTVHGRGTFDFLHQFLRWPKP